MHVHQCRQSRLRCLLASEVVHLMCLVPVFFESLEGHPGLMRMVVTATKNPNVADVIGGIAWKVQAKGVCTKQSKNANVLLIMVPFGTFASNYIVAYIPVMEST